MNFANAHRLVRDETGELHCPKCSDATERVRRNLVLRVLPGTRRYDCRRCRTHCLRLLGLLLYW